MQVIAPALCDLLTSPTGGADPSHKIASNACVQRRSEPLTCACPGEKVEDDTECVAFDLGELVICAVTSSSTIIIIIRNILQGMSLTLPGICKGIMGVKALSHSLPHLKPTRQEGKDPECSHFTDEKTELSKVKPRACPISDS